MRPKDSRKRGGTAKATRGDLRRPHNGLELRGGSLARHWPTGHSSRRCRRTSGAGRGAAKLFIPGDDGGRVAEREGAGEIDGVVTAQAELLRQVARLPGESRVDPDQEKLVLDHL